MRIEPNVGVAIRPRLTPSTVDRAIAWLAQRQHGVVSRAQLLSLGVSAGAIRVRVRGGRLVPLHRGIYAVGDRALSRAGQLMAAVLAAGPGAVLSHRSAAELHRILRRRPGPVRVTVPTKRRSQSGLLLTESFIAADEQETIRGIPVTTVARTLLDLAATEDEQSLDRALREAEINLLADETALHQLITRHPRRRGIATLKRLITQNDLDVITRSELEERFRTFHRTPPPTPAPRHRDRPVRRRRPLAAPSPHRRARRLPHARPPSRVRGRPAP